MTNKNEMDFGLGDRDSVLKELIRHDNSHMGSHVSNRVPYWSENIQDNQRTTYWSDYAPAPESGLGISLSLIHI